MSPSPGERISILIVDDHAVVRQGVRAFLETQPDFTVLHPRVAARVVQELHGATRSGTNAFTELSERELEVLRLIADGSTNEEIAAKLVISEKTVKSHVSNILSKLHVADRTQAAVYAWREGVVRRE